MMNYLTIEETAARWGTSPRSVQLLCAADRVAGAMRFGRAWMIPEGTPRPLDARTRAAREQNADMPLPRKTPFLYMTDLYHTAGSANESAEALLYHHEAYVLFRAEVAYSRGEIDRVYEHANYLLHKHSGFYAVLSAGMLLALCAIWRGDLTMWRNAKLHIAHAPTRNDEDREIATLALTAVDSLLYDTSGFPDWFKIGNFDPLPPDALPAAKVFYAKYLYANAYAVATRELSIKGVQGLSLMAMLPYTFEPMISQTRADSSIVAEIYLRLTCAATYHNSGNDSEAIRHIDRAIALALPDRLYGLLAEYCRPLDTLLEARLTAASPDAWTQVKDLYRIYHAGWARLSGTVRGKNIATTLSVREREVAKLAAFGMSNAEIAEKLHMSLSVVKQAIRVTSEKTGMPRDQFAAVL